MKVKIYHNPRCKKSREALQYLEEKGLEFEVIKYLDQKLTKEELHALLTQLNIAASDWVRKNEKVWKELYKGKKMTELEILEAMEKEPKLIERPVVVYKDKAVIARPLEKIDTLFN